MLIFLAKIKYNEVFRGAGGGYIYFWRTPEISSSFSNLKVSTIAIVIIIFYAGLEFESRRFIKYNKWLDH